MISACVLITEASFRATGKYSTSCVSWTCRNLFPVTPTARRRVWVTVPTRSSGASCPAGPFATISGGSGVYHLTATSAAFRLRPGLPRPHAVWSNRRSTSSAACRLRCCWWTRPWSAKCTGLPFSKRTLHGGVGKITRDWIRCTGSRHAGASGQRWHNC